MNFKKNPNPYLYQLRVNILILMRYKQYYKNEWRLRKPKEVICYNNTMHTKALPKEPYYVD